MGSLATVTKATMDSPVKADLARSREEGAVLATRPSTAGAGLGPGGGLGGRTMLVGFF